MESINTENISGLVMSINDNIQNDIDTWQKPSTIFTDSEFIINLFTSFDNITPIQTFLESTINDYKCSQPNYISLFLPVKSKESIIYYIISYNDALYVLMWTIKFWINQLLEIIDTDSASFCDSYTIVVNKIKEWAFIIENIEEEAGDDIMSTTNDVLDSVDNIVDNFNYMDVWNSSHMVAYPTNLCKRAGMDNMFELSIPTHSSTINSGDISNRLLWIHHTITNETATKLYIWFLTLWTNELILSSYLCLDNQKRTIKKMFEYVNMLV